MLGIIYHEGSPTVLYNIISKTSKSGLFSNERLAVLSIPQAIVGYLSKVPNLNDFQDINCINLCKEKTSISKQFRMISFISTSQPNTLILKWRYNEEKIWEFKFQNGEIAQLWNQYIQDILNPPQMDSRPTETKLKALKQELNQSQKQQPVQRQEKKEQFEPKPMVNRPQLDVPPVQDSRIDSSAIIEQKAEQKDIPSQPSTRFKDFQKNRVSNEEQFASQIPIITTYRQKFPNNSIFASIKASGKIKIQNNSSQNWNTLWFQAIDGQQQSKRLQIYNDFLACCQKHCKAIISELSILKSDRLYIPEKENASEQVYNRDSISINLLMEKDLRNSSELCSEYRVSDYRKIISNYSFLIKATKNKGLIKVPLACIYEYQGFTFFCQAKIPQDFFQVQPSQKLIFLPQVQRLQYQLNLKLNLSYLSLYANKISTITQSPNSKRRHFLILRQPKFVLPLIRCRGFKNHFPVSRNYFLQASSVYPKDFDFNEQKELWISNFFKAQNSSCTIISLQDLLQQFQKYSICYGMIIQLYFACSNSYLKRILLSEIISQVFYRIARTQIMFSLKQWNTNFQKIIHNTQQPNYKGIFISLLEQLFTDYSNPRNNTWTLIINELVDNFQINLKIDQIIPGYLLSSVALKLGINIDYQYFISQKGRLFTEHFIFSHVALVSLQSIFLSYSNEDLCESYEAMMDDIQSAEDESILKKLMNFFDLEQTFPSQPSYWKKICKTFSLFVPYKHQGEYSHMEIYSALNLLYVDFSIYSILCSAIKWLLFESKEVDAMINIEYFQDICWFWVSSVNPFMLSIYGILGQYYRSNSKYLESIKYFTRYAEDQAKILSEPPKEQLARLSEKLAKIYMTCGKHKESLDKYRQVKGYLKEGDKQPQFLRNVLAKISILYLHLGDIKNSLRYSKSATQLSILYPFEDEFQQFQVYSIFLRAFEITDENHKYKFYIDIIEDKFGRSTNPTIIQAILRLVMQQIIEKLSRLQTKKLGFLVFLIQKKQEKNQTRDELLKSLRFQLGNERVSKLLRDCIDSILDVCDFVAARQVKQPQPNPRLQKILAILVIFFKLIGFDYIVMLSKSRLTKK